MAVVGRSELVNRILVALGSGRAVSLSGAEGIGISTVLDEVSNRLVDNGEHPTLIRAVPSPRSFSALDPVTGGVAPGDRFEALSSQLRRRAGEHHNLAPIAIIDDAHLIDDDSAGVIYQLAVGGQVRLVMASREGASLPIALRRLTAMTNTQHHDVEPLSAESISAMLADVLPGYIERRTTNELILISGGNPSYLLALVQGSLAAGTLASARDTWRLSGPMHCNTAVAAAIHQSTASLTPSQRDALDTLALAGELELDLAQRIISTIDLERLERDGFILLSGADRAIRREASLRLASPLLAVVLAGRLGAFARQRMYQLLAEHVAEVRHPLDLNAVVWHVRGGVPLGADRLLHAAKEAVTQAQNIVAAELAAAAYATGHEIAAAVMAIRYLSHSGSEAGAMALAVEAFGRATEPFDRAALLHCVTDEAWWLGEGIDTVRARLLSSTTTSVPLGEWDALLDAQVGNLALMDGDLQLAERHRSLADHPLTAVRLLAAGTVAQLETFRGEPERGIALATALWAEASSPSTDSRASIVGQAGLHVIGLISALSHSGRLAEACQIAEQAHRAVGEGAGTRARAMASTLVGQLHLQSGSPTIADPWLAEAEALWADCGLPGITSWAATGRAIALASIGDIDGARAALIRAEQADRTGFRLMEPIIYLARTWLAVLDHDIAAADDAAGAAIDLATARGMLVHEAAIIHDLARLGLRDATKHALAITQSPRTAVTNAQHAVAASWLNADSAGLETAGNEWSKLGAPLFAAEAYTMAAGIFRQNKARTDAARLDGLAGKMLLTSDPARTPPLRNRKSHGPLTPRLVEVAELACQGMRTAEIAAKLVISQRSVESHMQRIYTRLGVTSRAELAEHMDRLVTSA
jgi:DNA-binding CsgD family transcriptional regulator